MTTLISEELSLYGVNGALPADMKAGYYGLGLVLPQDLNLKKKPEDLEAWKSYGLRLRQFMDSVEEKADKHNENSEALSSYKDLMAWAIGDFLFAGVKGGLKTRELKKHVGEIFGTRKDRAWGTLSNYMTTSKAIEISRRRESLSRSHHVEIQEFSPEEQDNYLKMAVDLQKSNRRFSVRDFRNAIASEKLRLDAPISEQDAKKNLLLLKIGVSEKERDWLREIGRAKGLGYNAATALHWMATEYFKEHKEELQEAVKALKAKEDEERERTKAIVAENQRRSREFDAT